MKTSSYVRIEKLEGRPDQLFNPALMNEWVPGEHNGAKGLPIGWTVEGYLLTDVEVGKPIKLDRRRRNNIDMIGDFQTSDIDTISDNVVATRNSIYRIVEIGEPPNE